MIAGKSQRLKAVPGQRSSISKAASRNSKAGRLPVLILPGFLSSDTRAPTSQYTELRQNLELLQHPTEVLQATTLDWLPTLSGGSFLWYLERLASAVHELSTTYGSQVCLVGVSAGGWLARLALGSVPYCGAVFGLSPLVHTLVTLGTPHQSLEAYPFGRSEEAWICELGLPDKLGLPETISTSLQYANHFYPDADSVRPTHVACVAGSAVCGREVRALELQDVLLGRQQFRALSDAWFIQSAYVANCGEAAVDGDGVTPISSALLPGADHLVLPGVWHNAQPQAGKKWYGTADVVEEWDKFLP